MWKYLGFIRKTLSVRLSLTVVFSIASLLIVALLVMFLYSRKEIKHEVMLKSEQTLECTVQRIDNILLSAEQAAGNMLHNVYIHLDDPDMMYVYSRKLVETSRYIKGCAIAMEPNFYKEKGKGELFMAYFHATDDSIRWFLNKTVVQSETFGDIPYNQQIWYTKPMETGTPGWIGPIKDEETGGSDIITFSLPLILPDGQKIGVMGVDVSISMLSKVMEEAKPSPNSYALLMNEDHQFIVHPSLTNYDSTSIYTPIKEVPSVVLEAMLSGKTSYKRYKHDGHYDYIFFKPFVRKNAPARSMEALNWSVGIVYPEDDILGDYNRLLNYVLVLSVIGLVLLLVLCQWITHRQLSSLLILTDAAHSIANGHYDETIPDSQHIDEVGRLQGNFKKMQQSLSVHINELERLQIQLHERNKNLQTAYAKAKEADRMKISFLHNMTNRMIEPIETINSKIDLLCNESNELSPQEANQIVIDVERQCMIIVELLNNLLKVSERLNVRKGKS